MKNVGTIDRTLRATIALAIAAAWYGGLITGTLALALGSAALVLLFTSLISFCPLYRLLGISSAPRA